MARRRREIQASGKATFVSLLRHRGSRGRASTTSGQAICTPDASKGQADSLRGDSTIHRHPAWLKNRPVRVPARTKRSPSCSSSVTFVAGASGCVGSAVSALIRSGYPVARSCARTAPRDFGRFRSQIIKGVWRHPTATARKGASLRAPCRSRFPLSASHPDGITRTTSTGPTQ